MSTEHWKRWLPNVVALLLVLPPAFAQESPLYTKWENYTIANGMPDEKVLSVAVDGDRVWAGTESGLVLIEDGQVKKVFKPEDGLANCVVTGIAVDENTGTVWIATFGGLSRYSGGEFQNYTNLTTGLANDIIYGVAVQDQYVWTATAAGISRLNTRSGEWSIFDNKNTPMREPLADGIAVGEKRVYFAVWGGGVLDYNIAAGSWKSHYNPDSDVRTALSRNQGPIHDMVSGVAYTRVTHMLWAATHFGLSGYDGWNWHNYLSTNSGLASDFINGTKSRGNEVWACTDKGLSFLNFKTDTWVTYRQSEQNGQGEIVITGPDGKVTNLETPTSLAHNYVLDVTFQDKDIWVATAFGLSHGIRGGRSRCKGLGCGGKRRITVPQSFATQSPVGNRAPVSSRTKVMNSRTRTESGTTRAQVLADLPESRTVNMGFFGPLENSPESSYGLAMLHGAQLAIDEANASGGYRAGAVGARKPYALKVHNDSAQWGASTTEPVTMAFAEHVVAVLGSIDGASTHNMLRVSSALEFPIVDTGTTDPTVTETRIPWLLHNFPDDRQQAHALADYVFKQVRLERVGVLRARSPYARIGAQEFLDEAKRIGNVQPLELDFERGDTDFSIQLRMLRDAGIEGLVTWGEPPEAALILKQMRAIGMKQPVFGPSRLAYPQLLEIAGPAAEGLVITCAMDPTRTDPKWQEFQDKYRKTFNEAADAYAAYAYDGIRMLIGAIEIAGLNRGRIMNTLRGYDLKGYEGVSGRAEFDRKLNNIAPVTMARVEGGKFVYWTERHEPSATKARNKELLGAVKQSARRHD